MVPSRVFLKGVKLCLTELDDQGFNVLKLTPTSNFFQPIHRGLEFPKELEFRNQKLLPSHADGIVILRRFNVEPKITSATGIVMICDNPVVASTSPDWRYPAASVPRLTVTVQRQDRVRETKLKIEIVRERLLIEGIKDELRQAQSHNILTCLLSGDEIHGPCKRQPGCGGVRIRPRRRAAVKGWVVGTRKGTKRKLFALAHFRRLPTRLDLLRRAPLRRSTSFSATQVRISSSCETPSWRAS